LRTAQNARFSLDEDGKKWIFRFEADQQEINIAIKSENVTTSKKEILWKF